MKALIADDDPATQRLLQSRLQTIGLEVVVANDGQRAWEAYQSERPSIVLTDWMMPSVSGLDLCRMIRAEARHAYTYVIMLTALAGKGSSLEGFRAGVDDFLAKPIDPDQLVARIHVAQRIVGLQERVRNLESLLRVCSHCSRIRDERGTWSRLSEYISTHTDSEVSHGLCGDCYITHVEPELRG